MTLNWPITRRHLLGSTFASLLSLPARAVAAEAAGFRVLEARKGMLRLRPAPAAETEIWGFDGQAPGPLLRYRKGEEIKLRLVNRLDQPLTLSFQGLRHDNIMDGVGGLTQKPVKPGESFDYRFTPADSGFTWYRSHVLPFFPEQLGRGLFGPLIVDEANPPEADRDLLLLLADWKLDDKTQISSDFAVASEVAGLGRIGNFLTIGSAPVPITETAAPGARLRLRVLNASNARIAFVSLVGLRPFVLAVDGQPCELFEPVRDTLPIGPGARFDVLLDLPATADATASLILRGLDAPDQPLVIFKTEGTPHKERPAIVSLPDNPRLPRAIKLEGARRFDILIEGGAKPLARDKNQPANTAKPDAAAPWKLNGQAIKEFGPTPAFSVKRGTPVVLAFINKTAYLQQMHVHGHNMRLLHDLDDGWEPYWRDCVIVPDGRTKHVAFVADNPGKWVIESLVAERQAAGMLTWFEVT